MPIIMSHLYKFNKSIIAFKPATTSTEKKVIFFSKKKKYFNSVCISCKINTRFHCFAPQESGMAPRDEW